MLSYLLANYAFRLNASINYVVIVILHYNSISQEISESSLTDGFLNFHPENN